MKNILIRRSLVCGITMLFLGLCITSGTGVNIEQTSDQLTKDVPAIFPLNVGELAWWKFDETSGNTAYDSSGHGYDGTVYGATWTGGGLDFDGADDYVDLDAHSVALGMNKTDDYFVYVRFQSTGSGMLYSMSHTNPARAYLNLELSSDGTISVTMGDETCLFDVTTSGTYNDGDWHCVEMEFYGSPSNPTLDIYVDGELDGSTTKWLCPMLDEDFLTAKIGRKSNAASDYFGGVIDDVKIYKNYEPTPEPPTNPIVTGEKNGNAGTAYEYTFTSTDDGCQVSYYIDWGDGDITDWTDFQPSGDSYSESHTWAKGTWIIKAKAKDTDGLESGVTQYTVTMTKSKAVNFNQLFLRFLEQHPNLFPILKYIPGL